MNILMVTRPLGKPWDEGGKNLAYNLANNIKNYNINILTKDNFSDKINKNINAEKIYSSSKKGRISYFNKIKLFIRLLKKDNSNIYHFIYTPELFTSLLNRFILRLKNKKSVQTITTTIINKKFIKSLIFADKVVVLSENAKKILFNNGFKNVLNINSGIDVNFFKPVKKDSGLIKKFNLNGKFVVLVPIELEPRRGTRVMLKSIFELSKSNKFRDLFFIFSYRRKDENLGERGFMISRLNKMNLRNFVFLESFYDVRRLISISDVVLYPTLSMNDKQEIPMVLLESLSMKKPIIITDIPPLNEILKTRCGLRINVGDVKDISRSLLEAKKNTKLRKLMGENGRKLVLSHFNIKNIAKEYENVYGSL